MTFEGSSGAGLMGRVQGGASTFKLRGKEIMGGQRFKIVGHRKGQAKDMGRALRGLAPQAGSQ